MPANTATAARNNEIRRMHSEMCWTISQLANEYGLSQITIRNIIRGRDLQPRPARRRIETSAATTRALGINRRFGVELEFFGIPRYVVQGAINAGTLPTGWTVKSDCSVRNGTGLELVSPPLSGEAGMESVLKACQWLRENGGQVDASCGLHVHHDARDLGAVGIARVARMYADNQSMINWLVAPSRRRQGYCTPLTEQDASYIERSTRVGSPRISAPTRYLALNVTSFGRHGTVEVRQHQGTLNFRKVEAWILFGQGLCDAAAESTRVSGTGVQSLLQALRIDEDAAAYLLGRAMQLGASTAEVAS